MKAPPHRWYLFEHRNNSVPMRVTNAHIYRFLDWHCHDYGLKKQEYKKKMATIEKEYKKILHGD